MRSIFNGCDASILWLQFVPQMFAPSISRRVRLNAQRTCTSSIQPFNASTLQLRAGFTQQMQRERASAFTLLELLIVVGIIGLLMVLIAPALTTIKSGTD